MPSPLTVRLRAWSTRAAPLLGVVLAQGASATLGALSGLLIVRALPPEDYARYLLAAGMAGALLLLADGGTSTGALSEGGKVWQDPTRLAQVLREVRRLRVRLSCVAGAAALPALAYLLNKTGAGVIETATWILIATILGGTMLQSALWEVPLRLHQRLSVTQGVGLGVAFFRLVAAGLVYVFWPLGLVAGLLSLLPQAWAYLRLRRAATPFCLSACADVTANPELRTKLQRVSRRLLPGAVYFVLYQNAGFWLLGLMGSTLAVAQLGALTRIGMLVAVIGSLSQAVWAPRFARLEEGIDLTATYFRRLAQALLLALPLLGLTWLVPSALLWLVGPDYAGLESNLLLGVVAAVLQTTAGIAMQLVYARSWLPPPWLGVGLAFATQLACFFLLDLGSLNGVLWLGVWTGVQSLLLHVAYFWYQNRRLSAAGPAPAPESQ
jgi:O-antigen/teichoic acid export membrane protein